MARIISHHDGCRLVYSNMWYHLNAIRHHDRFRLVHPAKWDISSMPYAIMTDADWTIGQFYCAFVTDANWCIPSCGSFGISIQFKMSGIDRFVYNSIYHSHTFGFQISHFNSIFTFILSFQRYTQSMYSFHILVSYLLGKLPKYLKYE